jgi:hypothetical protein
MRAFERFMKELIDTGKADPEPSLTSWEIVDGKAICSARDKLIDLHDPDCMGLLKATWEYCSQGISASCTKCPLNNADGLKYAESR